MSYIVPPPIKIEFPEQLALSNSISGDRINVAATERAVNLLREALITGIYPIGCPMPCPLEVPPSDDFFFMKGQAFDKVGNPILHSIYGDTLLDMRGKAIIGALDGENLLEFIAGQVKRHGHEGSVVTDTDLGRKVTSTDGQHTHTFDVRSTSNIDSRPSSYGTSSYRGKFRTDAAGEHTHYIDMGSHTHGLVIAEYGNDRNTIDSHLFNWMVRKG